MRCIVIWSVSCSPTWTSFLKCMQRVRSTLRTFVWAKGFPAYSTWINATWRFRAFPLLLCNRKRSVRLYRCGLYVEVRNVEREFRNWTTESWGVEIVRDTIEITCGDCYRNHDIPFVFYPHLEYVSSDCCLGDNQVHFSLRIKILFCNRFCCVKYVPIHFIWWCVCLIPSLNRW